MARSPQITTYPGPELKRIIETLAAESCRSASNQLLVWARERPEVRKLLNKETRRGSR